jgi:hypothetical protein
VGRAYAGAGSTVIMHEPPFLVEPFSPPLGDARCITVANSEIRVRCGQSQSTPDVMIDATHSLMWFEPRRAAPTKVKHPRRMKLKQVELHCCATASVWFYGGDSLGFPGYSLRITFEL